MAARAGTAYIPFEADFSKLRRQLAAEMAKLGRERFDIKGDVDVDTRGFTTKVASVRKQAEAQVAKPISQTLTARTDLAPFVTYMRAVDRADRETKARKIEQKLGLKVDKKSILTGLQEINQVRAEVARRAGIEEVVRLRLGVEADEAQIAAAVKQVEANVDRSGPVKKEVKFELDDASRAHVKAAIDDIERKAAGIRTIKTDYKVDTRTATAAFASLNRETEGTNRNLNQTTRAAAGTTGAFGLLAKSTTGLVGGMFQFKTRIPLVQLAVFGKILYTAAGGAISLAGALAPLTGLLGAIGPLASSAFQGIKTIGLATAGIGDAVKAAFSEQDKSAAGATSSMAAATGAAEAVRAATVSLGDAERTQRFAVEDLTRAREEGTRQIEDMRAAVRNLALEEEGATLGLKEAKQALNQLVAEGADQLEVDRALLSVKEARSELQKTRQEGKRARSDLGAIGAAGGVKGLPQVVQARRSLADANRGVAEAERELAKAVKQSSEAMGGGGAAADALKQKMAGLAPAAQTFAKFLIGLRPKLKQLQATAAQGLLPGVQKGIKAAMENFPRLNKIIKGTSEVLGDLAEQAGKRLGSEEWGKDLETQGKRNEVTIGRLGTAGLNLAEAFKDVTLAAGPLVDRLTKWVVALTDGWKESANAARESGKLQAFFKDAGDTFFKTVHILRDLAVSFKNIGSAARLAFGDELLGNIKTGAANLREWTGSLQGQREMRSVFRDIGEDIKAVGRFVQALSEDFRQLKKEGNTTGEAIAHIMTNLLAEMIVAGAKGAGQFLKAFGEGFLKAGPFEKLILAAIAFPKIAAVGRAVGFVLGAGVSQGAVAGIAGTGGAAAGGGLLARIGSKLLPAAKRVGIVGLGVALADVTLKEFSRRMGEGSGDAFKELKNAAGPDPLGLFSAIEGSFVEDIPGFGKIFTETERSARSLIPALKGIEESSRAISPDRAEELRKQIAALPGISNKARDAMLGIVNASAGSAKKIFTNIGDLSNTFDKVGNSTAGAVKLALDNIGLIGTRFGFESKRGTDAVRDNFRALSIAIRDNMDEGRTSVRQGFRAMRDFAIKNSRDVAGSAQRNFGAARDFIRDAVHDGLITSRRGLKLIRDLWFTEMAFYGFSKAEALGIRKARKGQDRVQSFGRDAHRTEPGKQRGGLVAGGLVPFGPRGAVGPDSIPVDFGGRKIVVAPGEVGAVFNRHQLPVLNARLADLGGLPGFFNQYNRKHSQARGGLVGKAKRFAAGGIVALGRKLQREGYMVGEHPAFGPVSPRPENPDSLHFSGQAIDVNADNFPGGEKSALDKLYARLKRLKGVIELLWQVSGHFDHLHVAMGGKGDLSGLPGMAAAKLAGVEVTGPDSGIKSIVQRTLDFARSGAQQTLDDAAASMSMEGAEPSFAGVSDKGGNRAIGKRMAARYGWGSGPQWAALDHLWGVDESGWDETILNLAGSGAYGIAQALPSTKYPSAGQLGAPDGPAKAKAQIAWGLNYIKTGNSGSAPFRDPIGADAFRHAVGWYDSGGIGFGGGARGAPGHKGFGPLSKKLPKALQQTLRRVTKGATKKKRSKALDAFKRKIGKLGLPDKLQTAILGQLEQHERFSDLATRAQGLSTEDENTGVAQLAKVGGKNEGGWLVDDLSVLTALRNNLLKVRKIILKRQGILERALKVAQEQLKKLSKKGTTPRKWKGLNPAKDPIAKWNKQPGDKRQKRVKEWHKMRGHLPGDREFAKDGKLLVGPGRRKRALQELIPSLKTQRNKLLNAPDVGLGTYGSSGTGMLATLFAVQGWPASGDLFKRWPILPPIGEFGGHIGDAQTALAALGESLIPDRDSSSPDTDDSGRGERFEELLRLERQRTLVRDIEVAELLRSARQPPFAGAFATGGTVPGPVGAARTAIVHGGETITPPGRDGDRLRLILEDHRVRVYRNDVEMIVDQKLRGVSRGVGRTPGLAGSLKP